jgi:hypothetical protein
MPTGFHEVIKELLEKDPTQRLGSDNFLHEFINHSYLKTA